MNWSKLTVRGWMVIDNTLFVDVKESGVSQAGVQIVAYKEKPGVLGRPATVDFKHFKSNSSYCGKEI